jgi:iron(III) transport system substrate-binding protein
MLELGRRRVLGGLLAGAATAALGANLRAQAAAGTIDLEQARGEGTVTLYTSLDTKIVDSIIGSFTEKYEIKVEYFRGGSADVTSKVLAEADADRLQADIVDASDVAALMLMKERGILKPYRSAAT